MTKTSILIIGAGPSGLAALKEMRAAGLEALAVDAREDFGGVFSPQSDVTFEHLHLTTSNMFMSFSDFPAKDKYVKYWTKEEYYEYLTGYVEQFGLREHLQLGIRVRKAHFVLEKKAWRIHFQDVKSGESKEETFDNLIVASGANHVPFIPEFVRDSKCRIMHSAEYKSSSQVAGKNVLVLGMGESSADVAGSASKTASSVTLWNRRFPDCAPRFIEQYTKDPDYDEEILLQGRHFPRSVLECMTTSRAVRNLPLGGWSALLQKFIAQMNCQHGSCTTQNLIFELASRAWRIDYYSSDHSVVPTKSCVALSSAAKGEIDIVISPKLKFHDRMATFEDAHLLGGIQQATGCDIEEKQTLEREIDVIVACTGFRLNFDWITTSDPSKLALHPDPRSWYKHAFPSGFQGKLAFVGFARPHSGGIPQCSEMVARYIALLCTGERNMPKNAVPLTTAEGMAEESLFLDARHNRLLVDYYSFMMSVAKLVGCTPAVPWNPMDMVKYWTFPLWPCFFRTQGVGAKPEVTKQVLSKFGAFDSLAPFPVLVLELICAFCMPCINFISYLLGDILMGESLPVGYKWRISKGHILYRNSLTLSDFLVVPMQWIASLLIVLHLIQSHVLVGKPKLASKSYCSGKAEKTQ